MNRTGRTTRLLKEAVSLAKEGKTVFVISTGNSLVRGLRSQDFPDELKHSWYAPQSSYPSVKVKNGEIVFFRAESGNIDWENLTIRGYPSTEDKTVVLVDHYVIEMKFKKLLNMLHRYDPDCGNFNICNSYDPDCGNFNICNPAEEVKFTKEQKVAFAKEQHKRMLDLVRKGLQ
jgi:hypothetical protein